MAVLISFALFAALMVAISIYGYRRYAKPGRLYEQLGGPTAMTTPIIEELPGEQPHFAVNVIEEIGKYVPTSPQDAALARRELIAAGYRNESAVAILFGLKIVLCAALVILGFLFRAQVTSNPVLGLVLVAAAGFVGYFGPNFYLDHLVDQRQEALRLSLPDALDLLVISVEAGLGLDQAIQYVARELSIAHQALAEELGLLHLEIRAGKRRAEALRNLADRTGERELRKLVAVLIQTDKFGTSMAESLRTHSDFMRVRRRQEAEERAGKVGVKLVFPIFFFILPSMLLVAAGPGLLQVFKHLFPIMRQFKG
ncbi:MAG TPA: type II secretion system F family protein [Bryobacteraceae bacterium]|nr:type II secretion system F family protein [Bryobacteraceae bacterium]